MRHWEQVQGHQQGHFEQPWEGVCFHVTPPLLSYCPKAKKSQFPSLGDTQMGPAYQLSQATEVTDQLSGLAHLGSRLIS